MRRLVVNADDFGFTRDVNDGIIEAHVQGILTATTLMANGPAFEHAVQLAREHPALDVGCHLVLVGGDSLRRPGEKLPSSVSGLLRALVARKLDAEGELRPQIERILAAGIRPYHLDTHKHTHLWPAVLDVVARLSEEYRIPWVRRPFDLPVHAGGIPWGKKALNRCLHGLRRQFHAKLAKHGCRTTDHFAGFQLTGRFRAQELVSLFGSLPDGLTEFMCHPGRCTAELQAAQTRLKESRQCELDALIAPQVRQTLMDNRVRLMRYRDL
jgi:predicted glycoside hydrolase/deacetylase ChbG (UPF0249 family)